MGKPFLSGPQNGLGKFRRLLGLHTQLQEIFAEIEGCIINPYESAYGHVYIPIEIQREFTRMLLE